MPREVEVHITVVICTWNRCELLRQTLEQMTRLVIPPRVRWSVVVVDNNSTDDTATVIESFGGCLPIRRVFEPTPGQSHARNAGLREAEDPSRILWKLPWQRNAPADRLTTLRPHATFCHSFARNEGSCL